MKEKFKILNEYLIHPLNIKSRVLMVVAALVLVPSFFFPLWQLDFSSQQYPEGLILYIHVDKMEGGDDGNDLVEINVLNHYIGMAELKPEDFSEFQWIPLIIGLMIVLSLRAAVMGPLKSMIDILVFTMYFAAFSLWRFYQMLYTYGHNLDPRAAVRVEPFMPPVFGTKMVGQFTVVSYPSIGSFFFILFVISVLAGVYFTYKEKKING